MKRLLPLVATSWLLLESCGLIKSDYVAYENPEAVEPGAPETCETGTTEFAKAIAPILSEKCITCHGAAGTSAANKLTLTSDNTQNRTALLKAKSNLGTTALNNYVASDDHPGKSSVNADNQTAIEQWLKTESTCLTSE